LKNKNAIPNISAELFSSLLILLFTYAALSKLIDFRQFYYQLQRSPFFAEIAAYVSVVIPLLELICVALLALRLTRLLGFFVAYFLMAAFSAYVYAILNYSLEIPCSCGGVLAAMSCGQHFIFNLVFTAIALAGIVSETYLKFLSR
jgi:hypothetical protein